MYLCVNGENYIIQAESAENAIKIETEVATKIMTEGGFVLSETPLESITATNFNRYFSKIEPSIELPKSKPTENEMLRDYVLDLDYRLIMIELGI